MTYSFNTIIIIITITVLTIIININIQSHSNEVSWDLRTKNCNTDHQYRGGGGGGGFSCSVIKSELKYSEPRTLSVYESVDLKPSGCFGLVLNPQTCFCWSGSEASDLFLLVWFWSFRPGPLTLVLKPLKWAKWKPERSLYRQIRNVLFSVLVYLRVL